MRSFVFLILLGTLSIDQSHGTNECDSFVECMREINEALFNAECRTIRSQYERLDNCRLTYVDGCPEHEDGPWKIYSKMVERIGEEDGDSCDPDKSYSADNTSEDKKGTFTIDESQGTNQCDSLLECMREINDALFNAECRTIRSQYERLDNCRLTYVDRCPEHEDGPWKIYRKMVERIGEEDDDNCDPDKNYDTDNNSDDKKDLEETGLKASGSCDTEEYMSCLAKHRDTIYGLERGVNTEVCNDLRNYFDQQYEQCGQMYFNCDIDKLSNYYDIKRFQRTVLGLRFSRQNEACGTNEVSWSWSSGVKPASAQFGLITSVIFLSLGIIFGN